MFDFFGKRNDWVKIEAKDLPKWVWLKYLHRVGKDIREDYRNFEHEIPCHKKYIFKGSNSIYKVDISILDVRGNGETVFYKKKREKRKSGKWIEVDYLPSWIDGEQFLKKINAAGHRKNVSSIYRGKTFKYKNEFIADDSSGWYRCFKKRRQ